MSDLPQMPLASGTMASRLALDTSGESLNNRIIDEPHTLSAHRFRAFIPKNGAFYTEGSSVVDTATGRTLDVGIDYRYIIPYQSLTLLYGKEVVGGFIVINPEVSSNVATTYQAVGSDYVYNIPAIEELLSTDNNTEVSKSYLDMLNRDLQVIPTPHLHPLGDGVGFEYLVFAIEALGRVITYGDNKVLASMFERIDIKLAEIAKTAQDRQDGELMALMTNFRKNFGKTKMGLDKVPNLPAASEQEGRYAANPDYVMGSEVNNRLITITSLIGFRDELMRYFVSSDTTGLGQIYGKYLLPTFGGLESMTNGARFLIDSVDASMVAGIPYDPQIYPDLTANTHRWVMEKVSNNANNRGGLLRCTNMQTGQMYMGVMSYVNGVARIAWRKHITEQDMTDTLKLLTDHMLDVNNPHQLRASDIGLGNVENLRVADRLTILGKKPKRELVDAAGLALFFRAIITDDWTIDDSDDATPEQKAKARNAYTTLFAASGMCCDGGLTLETAPRVTDIPVPPRGQPQGWYCEDTTKITKITDGFGGYYLENTLNSEDCGYIAEVANYEIRDQAGVLIGLGFKAGGRVDSAATVALQNADAQTVCWIYSTPATGRTTTVLDANNIVLGYAIDPK